LRRDMIMAAPATVTTIRARPNRTAKSLTADLLFRPN
jgi:hypothetical protein